MEAVLMEAVLMEAVLVAAVVAVAAGALAQAISGIGFSLVCAPFLVALLGAREGVRTAIVLSAVLNAVVLVREHRGVLVAEGALLLAPAVAVTPLAAWAVGRVGGRALALAAGVLVLVSAVGLAAGLRLPRAAGRAGAVGAGALSGAMNVVGGIAGPAVAVYALNAGWPPAAARATLQAYFLVLNLAALASLGVPRPPAGLLVGLAAGWLVGALVADRVDWVVARRATLAVAAAGGVVAVARAVTG